MGESAIIAVSDTAFIAPSEALAPRAATSLRSIGECSRDDGPRCSRLREYFCRRMLSDVSADRCSSYCSVDPEEEWLLVARNVTHGAGIAWPEAPTRG